MNDDDYDKNIFDAEPLNSITSIRIWNKAIEEAAKCAANAIGEKTLLATHTCMEIRKLKK